jgi:hypothetical protein
MRDDDLRPRTYRIGRAALGRLKNENSYLDWIAVSNATVEARDEALEAIGMERPICRRTGSAAATKRNSA